MSTDRIILNISPQTNIRSSQGDKILFRIPTECKKLKGKKPCVKFRKTGECPHILSEGGRKRKKRLERYNQYKVDVLTLANAAGFQMPSWGWSVYFYVPIPASYTKEKRAMLHGQPNMKRPDIDNFYKAMSDSLSISDETVAQLSGLGKFWVDTLTYGENGEKIVGPGWIEILLNQPPYNPFSVTFIDQKALAAKPARKWVRNEKPQDKSTPKSKPLKLDKRFLKEDKLI